MGSDALRTPIPKAVRCGSYLVRPPERDPRLASDPHGSSRFRALRCSSNANLKVGFRAGGQYARYGFRFQDLWIAFNLLDWISEDDFHGFVNEGLDDVDVFWSSGSKRACDIHQLKDHTLAPSDLDFILRSFQRKHARFPMSGYHVVATRCSQRLNTLPRLLKRTRDYGLIHGQKSRLANAAVAEFGDKLASLGVAARKAPFVVERVYFDFAAGWISNPTVFQKQFNFRLRIYGIAADHADEAGEALVALISGHKVGELVPRKAAIALLDKFKRERPTRGKPLDTPTTASVEHRQAPTEALLDEPILITIFPDDAVMLRLPGGLHGLIDCGMTAASWIIPYLEEHKVDAFDFIAITHWDADRFRGVLSVVDAVKKVRKFLVPAVPGEEHRLMKGVLSELPYHRAIGELQATNGRTIIWELVDRSDRSARVEAFAAERNDPAIWISRGRRYMSRNDLCTVFRVSAGDRHFLITADATIRRWSGLLGRQLRAGESLQAAGLTLPRHGSTNSLNKEILHKVADPSGFYAVVDPAPRYGLPHRQLLDLVREENGEIIVCDTNPVHLLLTRDGLFARRFALGDMFQSAAPISPRPPTASHREDGPLEL